MRNRNVVLLQLALIFLVWSYVATLHWQNDGLWFQGDSPRHAANGLFWKEFLTSGSLNPQDYALRYYARYPVISPTNYPPVFYILEGAAFTALHPSPYVAKSLVLGFALLAACYLMAWLRRWVAEEAGWMAALLLLLPGFVVWSNTVMLNVPATAFSIAALYHARRWMEAEPSDKHQLYLAAVFSVCATLTYFVAGILVFIIAGWLLSSRRWALLWDRRTLCVALVSAIPLIPFLYIALKWAPIYVSFVTTGPQKAGTVSGWIFYLRELLPLAGPCVLALSVSGMLVGTIRRRWRHESFVLLVFLLVNYLALSLIVAKESRYGLLLCVPIVCFCAIAIQSVSELPSWRKIARFAALPAMLILLLAQFWIASRTSVPRIQGIAEAVAFIERVAPDEPVFYDGFYSNVFTFYIQAGDPGYRRRVVLGPKLLYASAINPLWRYESYVNSSEDIIKALLIRGGCRWLAIEISDQAGEAPAARLLRETVQGPQFEKIRSFPVSGLDLNRIDVYRFKLDPQPSDEADLPFPILGKGTRYKVKPIQR